METRVLMMITKKKRIARKKADNFSENNFYGAVTSTCMKPFVCVPLEFPSEKERYS